MHICEGVYIFTYMREYACMSLFLERKTKIPGSSGLSTAVGIYYSGGKKEGKQYFPFFSVLLLIVLLFLEYTLGISTKKLQNLLDSVHFAITELLGNRVSTSGTYACSSAL